ncbi:MAG: TrbG/VirB9 family P-type conjugative transfer protein [Boseongicola sp.]|nr:TrbG/VirB9 family P-type conjugative transfer protein [Boseongicola sp.]
MRRAGRFLPRRVATAAAAAAFARAVVAQDVPPEDIGTDLLGIAREALPAAAAQEPEVPQVADTPALAGVPHPLGATEIVPLQDGVAQVAPDPVPDGIAVRDALPRPSPAGAAAAGPKAEEGPEVATATAASDVQSANGGTPETEIAAAESPKPIDQLKGIWRQAVASGDTSEGFEAWISAALDPPRPGFPTDESQAALTREVAVAWGRRTGPVTLGQGGRIVTTFGEAIPTALCSPLTVCYIELEPGEQLTDTPSVGDAVRWQVVPKVQGRPPAERVVIEIKPAEDAVETNLVIPTDRRLYSIALVNDPEYHTPILAFRWPDSEARAVAEGIERRRAEELAVEEARDAEAASRAEIEAAELARSGVPTETGPRAAELLDFRFRVDGKAPFRPVRVFADGSRTYIDLHPGYRGPLPAIVAGKAEGNAALNTRVSASGSRLVADRVITDVWLQSGRERVRIRRIAN